VDSRRFVNTAPGLASREAVYFATLEPVTAQNPFKWESREDAEIFADALARLADAARHSPVDDSAAFAEKAAAWRALTPKPGLSPDADRERILAEAAFREKKPEVAFSHFERALAIEPCWPDGNFNAALLAGELGVYEDALRYMRRYLMLVPDSKDAAGAREKIIVWEDKLAHPQE
jgi:tetratricopeptide (TPR) repeat protein